LPSGGQRVRQIFGVNAVVRPRSDLTIEEIDGDLVVLDSNGEQIHQFNAPARIIWARLASGDTQTQIADTLIRKFNATREVIEADVEKMISQFDKLGLLEN